MGVDPPFLYDHPSKYSFVGPTEKAFNPKAASHASWSAPSPRPRPDGPLTESKQFNRHPDSYFVVPYGNLNYIPMSRNTKSKVKWTRLTQLILRICELLGAVAILFCAICIKDADVTTGWVIRVPPGVAILHTIYAIYHLARSPKGRTPSSSASYMLFAAIVDVGLIPFLVFTALMSRTEYIEPVNATGHWTTLFGSDEATTKITHSTFLISVVSGSLHLVSLIISIYLGVVFRKISRLPPDMNPLEDNLTSRHKRNKSHLSLLDSRMSKTSMGTPTGKGESKPEDPLIPQSRTVPFMLTRHVSNENITNVSHSISNARDSRRDLSASPFNDQPSAHRTSQTNVKDPSYTQARSPYWSRTKVQSHYPNQSVSPIPSTDLRCLPVEQAPIKQAAEANVSRCSTRSSSIYSSNTITTIATSRPASASCRSIAPTSPDSNWIIHSSRSPSPQPSSPRELEHLRNKQPYQPLSQTSPFSYTSNDEDAFPKPLEMNPPTPPIQQQKRRQDVEKRALTPRAGNVRQENRRPGPGMVGIGKARTRGAVDSSGMGGGGRVVSRSGIEVRQGGILPMGGVRAREVSGKVMEEGRGHTGSWM